MKKTILSWVLISSSFMVFAQIDTTRQAIDTTRRDTTNMYNSTSQPRHTDTTGVHNNMNVNKNMNANVSSKAYNAYGAKSVTIPYRAQLNLAKDYPMAANANIAWTQSGEWYHGTYMNNGRYSHIYYDDRGNTWTVALPVTESYVPDDIVSKASTMFGPAIYDLTTLKGDSAHPAIYQIRTIDNGQVKAQWIGDDGSSIMDPFRSDVQVNMNTSTNAAKDNNMNNADSTRVNAMDSMNNMNRNNMNNMNRNNMNMNRNNMNNMNRNNMNNMNRNNMDSTRNRMNNSMDSTRSRVNNSMDSTGNNMNRDMHNVDSTSHNMMDSSRHSMDSTDHMSLMNMNSSDSTMNNAADSTRNTEGTKMKIKTKNSDGTETKVKVKDGQLKTKED